MQGKHRCAGPSTVLRKTKHADTRLAASAQKGSRSVRVEDPSGFARGDQVAIRDKDAQGWNVVLAADQPQPAGPRASGRRRDKDG